jgi:hypothetical protein
MSTRRPHHVDVMTDDEVTLARADSIERLPYGYVLRPSARGPVSSTNNELAFSATLGPESPSKVVLTDKTLAVLLMLTLAVVVLIAVASSGPADAPRATTTSSANPPPPSAATTWDPVLPTAAIPSSGGVLPKAERSEPAATGATSTLQPDVRPKPARPSRKARTGVRERSGDPAAETEKALVLLRQAQLETHF